MSSAAFRYALKQTLALLAALLLTGCAWPTREDPFCLPKAKYQRQTHTAVLGMRCAW